jgi:hypothetical protein
VYGYCMATADLKSQKENPESQNSSPIKLHVEL